LDDFFYSGNKKKIFFCKKNEEEGKCPLMGLERMPKLSKAEKSRGGPLDKSKKGNC